MNMIIGRRQLVLASLVLALGIAIYLNWRFAETDGGLDFTAEISSSSAANIGDAQYVNKPEATAVSADAYFTGAKTDRDKAQADALKILQNVVADEKASAESKEKAAFDIERIAKNVESQSAVENLVKAKGFADCVTIITGDQVNVIVKASGLLDTEILQIQDIVTGQTKYPLENIKIVERK